jgi:hypothetical protein
MTLSDKILNDFFLEIRIEKGWLAGSLSLQAIKIYFFAEWQSSQILCTLGKKI